MSAVAGEMNMVCRNNNDLRECQSFQAMYTKKATDAVFAQSDGWIPRLSIVATPYKVEMKVIHGTKHVATILKMRGKPYLVTSHDLFHESCVLAMACRLEAEFQQEIF